MKTQHQRTLTWDQVDENGTVLSEVEVQITYIADWEHRVLHFVEAKGLDLITEVDDDYFDDWAIDMLTRHSKCMVERALEELTNHGIDVCASPPLVLLELC